MEGGRREGAGQVQGGCREGAGGWRVAPGNWSVELKYYVSELLTISERSRTYTSSLTNGIQLPRKKRLGH